VATVAAILEPVAAVHRCYRCGNPVSWTLPTIGSFYGTASLLYHYGRLLLPEARYRRPSDPVVWGCDTCQPAGVIVQSKEGL
jgi:hypothetical protein